jgi:putative component of membrane protein insertase Oxa1/YidC/SpoIIIJ protein YidD
MKNIIFILFLSLISQLLLAQTKQEVVDMLTLTEEKHMLPDYSFTLEGDNEVELIVSNLFIFYKKYVSSQDSGNCGFVPSCSVYALHAMRNQGVLMGVINFFDRYSRCHGLSPESYTMHEDYRLLIDPVRTSNYEDYLDIHGHTIDPVTNSIK